MAYVWCSYAQLDVAAVVDALSAQGCEEDKLDALGERIGFADTVTVEQLVAAGFTNRVVFEVRRRLVPRAAAVKVPLVKAVRCISQLQVKHLLRWFPWLVALIWGIG